MRKNITKHKLLFALIFSTLQKLRNWTRKSEVQMIEENEKSYRAAIFSRGEIFDSKGVAT